MKICSYVSSSTFHRRIHGAIRYTGCTPKAAVAGLIRWGGPAAIFAASGYGGYPEALGNSLKKFSPVRWQRSAKGSSRSSARRRATSTT